MKTIFKIYDCFFLLKPKQPSVMFYKLDKLDCREFLYFFLLLKQKLTIRDLLDRVTMDLGPRDAL